MINPKRQRENHRSDQANTNRGSKGTNPVNSHVHGNRGAQLNPNRKK